MGRVKVEGTATAMRRLEPSIEVQPILDRFRPKQRVGEVIFACVDSIEARGAIWRSAGRHVQFWADGRMLGETIRVLTVADKSGRDHYPTTLFAAGEAQVGACTSRSTIYAASIAAG